MKIITTLIVILLHCFVFSQEWTTLQSDEKLSINFSKINYESKSDGINHERIVFQYQNLTNSDLTVTFQRSVSYGADQSLQEKTYQITIPANGSIEYNESNAKDKTFYVFAKDLKGTIKRSLSNFEFTNIQIQ